MNFTFIRCAQKYLFTRSGQFALKGISRPRWNEYEFLLNEKIDYADTCIKKYENGNRIDQVAVHLNEPCDGSFVFRTKDTSISECSSKSPELQQGFESLRGLSLMIYREPKRLFFAFGLNLQNVNSGFKC